MTSTTLVLCGKQVVLPGRSEPCPATIEVSRDTGKITKVLEKASSKSDYPSEVESIELANDQILLPGLVDVHVHLNAPGREQWEGFKTGTQAAASGGVTTLVDMPLNSIPSTTTVSNLKQKTDRAQDSCYIDVAFWGGVVPDNAEDLVPLIDAGVKGFKCFLCNSGVDEFRHVEEEDLHRALPKIQHKGRKMLFHAELGDRDEESSHSHREYSTFLKTSPESMEESAIALVARLTEQYAPIQTHIVHLSASSALPILREARRVKKLPLSVETCIHYLTLEAEVVPEGRTDYKCCPPIRGRANRDALWQALQDGDIDFIVSDHSPCTADLKRLDEGNFLKAWGGIGGLGLGISLLYTECQRRNISICKLVEWMSSKPAAWIGLENQKGSIKEGADADFVIFDVSKSFKITTDDLYFKNKVSPYTGMQVDGRVIKTYLRGQAVFDIQASNPFLGSAKGRLLL